MAVKKGRKSVKKAGLNPASNKWTGIVAGVFLYLLWYLCAHNIKFFSGFLASDILYLIFFLILLTWSIIAGKISGFFSFTAATLALLCAELLKSGENILGNCFFLLALALSLYGITREYFAYGIKAKKNRGKIPFLGKRSIIVLMECLLIILMLAGVRESDIIVSKYYFVPWPIYPDYVYPADVEKVSFKSLDGTVLNGWFFHGKMPDAKKRPVLLYLHGNSGNMAAQYGQFEFLTEWGYDVFTFDFRGFGLSGGKPGRRGIWADTKAAFQEMTVLMPGRKYGIVGFSMGSIYAMLLAANEPRVSAAVFLTCFTSFREIGVHNLKAWWGIPAMIADPLGALVVPNGLDPLESAEAAALPPALFAHGTADGTIPYAMGEKMAGLYKGKKTFLPMPEYNHGDYFKGPLAEQFHRELDNVFLKEAR